LTLDRLKEGNNILIFPEDRNKKYMESISAMYYNIQCDEDL